MLQICRQTVLRFFVLLIGVVYVVSSSVQANSSFEPLQPIVAGQRGRLVSSAVSDGQHSATEPAKPSATATGAPSDRNAPPQCPSAPNCPTPTLLDTCLAGVSDICLSTDATTLDPAEASFSGPGAWEQSAFGVNKDRVSEADPASHQDALTSSQQHVSHALEEERHNFALSKDGAKIIASNKEAKKASAILDTDSDTFMKNECKVDQWFILELSQVAKVDAFQLSQYELYSSRVKDFEVRGRQSHPRAQGGDYSKALNTSGWQLLGKYTAAKIKGTQTFEVSEPAWQKYLQFHFISHHGSEPICALNDLLVFGKSAAEDLEDQLSSEDLLTEGAAASQQPSASRDAAADNATAQHSQPPGAGQLAVQPEKPKLAVQADPKPLRADTSLAADLPPKVQEQEPVMPQQPAHPIAAQEHQPGELQHQVTSQSLHQPSVPDTASAAKKRRQAIDKEIEGLLQAPPIRAPEQKADTKADLPADELLLPHNSAGSAKARHGGTIYDMLVQEIKSLKLQQKQLPRQLAELQRNISLHIDKTTMQLSALDQAMKGLQADLDLMQRAKHLLTDDASNTAVARLSDVDVDLSAVLMRLEQMQRALHQVQHRVTAIVLLAIIAWLGVVVLTAPALGQLTWILWVPICLIAAIGVMWLMPVVLRAIPAST